MTKEEEDQLLAQADKIRIARLEAEAVEVSDSLRQMAKVLRDRGIQGNDLASRARMKLVSTLLDARSVWAEAMRNQGVHLL